MNGTLEASPRELVVLAGSILGTHESNWTGSWARAVAFLTRQALEDAIDLVWADKKLSMDRVSTRAQLLCLGAYLKDEALTADVRNAWGALSQACHHHPYELAPTAGELAGWLATAESLVVRMEAAELEG